MHVIPVVLLLRLSRGYIITLTPVLLSHVSNQDRGPDRTAFSRLCSVQHLDLFFAIHVPQFFATE
jgi:hypothetical protein